MQASFKLELAELTPNFLERLKEMFSDVFVYTQESLKDRPQEFISALKDFLSINEDLVVSKKANANVGVSTELQVNTLRKMNGLNDAIKKLKYLPDLYSRPFRKLKLTPRNICQIYLRNINEYTTSMQMFSFTFLSIVYTILL